MPVRARHLSRRTLAVSVTILCGRALDGRC